MVSHQQPAKLPVGTLLAKRYTVVRELGVGGFGAVYEATDRLTDQQVAIKLLRPRGERDKQQFRAEVSLLRLLRLPNLIHLIDDGEIDGFQFLVTDVVRGVRFPGLNRRPSWKDIEYTTLCLLESLARVHAYGVVHRDLKPSNVFVDRRGEPTILDFGVSFGPGFRRDNSGRVVGTPAFLSPEQAAGQRGDARSDLYSLAVMVYEALSGRLPHSGDTLQDLLAAKINVPPVPLRNVAPHVPPGVAFAIDAMLRTEAHLRPPNATMALELFGVRGSSTRLPWVGKRDAVTRAVGLLSSGQSFVTEGASGLGHSRLLEEIAVAFEEGGGEAWFCGHAEYKWGSLPNELLSRVERLPELSDDDMVELLRDAAADGVVLLIDDAPLVDKQTRQAVRRSGIPTAWVGEAADLPRVALHPLEATDVEELFHGPELIVHLRSDAAALAVRMSEGRARALAAQLDGWVKAGIGYWDHGKIRVTREALDRIETGLDVVPPEADSKQLPPSFYATLAQQASDDAEETLSHETLGTLHTLHHTIRLQSPPTDPSLSQTLRTEHVAGPTVREDPHLEIAYSAPPGTRGRFLRLIRAGAVEDVVEEALWLVQSAQSGGNPRQAFAAVREALAVMRATGRRGREPEILRALTLLALESQGARECDLALYDLEHGRDGNALVEAMIALLHYRRLGTQHGQGADRDVFTPRDRETIGKDPRLERWRWGREVLDDLQRSPERGVANSCDFLRWAQETGDLSALASAHTSRGLALYSQRRFQEAAVSHEQAAAVGLSQRAAAVRFGNAASCWLEAGERDRAANAAELAFRHADASRHLVSGVRATWLRRVIPFRFGQRVAPDPEIVELYESLGNLPYVMGYAWTAEASIAWRSGEMETALTHARASHAAAASAGHTTVATLARCLMVATGGDEIPPEIELLSMVRALPFARLRAQACALVIVSGNATNALVEQLGEELPLAISEHHGAPFWEFFSPEECSKLLHDTRSFERTVKPDHVRTHHFP